MAAFFSLVFLSFIHGLALHTAAAPIHTTTTTPTPTKPPNQKSLPRYYRDFLAKGEDHNQLLLERLARDSQRANDIFQTLSVDENSTTRVISIPAEYLAIFEVAYPEYEQRIALIVDPGSSLIWWQCNCDAPGSQCYPQSLDNPIYDIEDSDSYYEVSCDYPQCIKTWYTSCSVATPDHRSLCQYNVSYVNGVSSRGNVSTELFMFENYTEAPRPIIFGCGEFQTGSQPHAEASGVLGLSMHPYSMTSQLNASVFSVCLPSRMSGFPSTLDFHMEWSPPTSFMLAELIEPPFGNPVGFYYVEMVQLQVGYYKVDVPQGLWGFESGSRGTIVDIGATLTYLPNEAFYKFRQLFRDQVRLYRPNLTPVEIPGMPDYMTCYTFPPGTKMNQLQTPPVYITMGTVYVQARCVTPCICYIGATSLPY